MLRRLILAAILANIPASAAMWPDKLGGFDRKSVATVEQTQPDQEEYGRDTAEEADYGSFKVTGIRYKDSTGAYAAALAAKDHPLQVGNYLVACSGKCPKNLAALAEALPRVSHAPLPVLASYLPARRMIAGSERYIMGPLSLHENLPQIGTSTVALDFGTEGEAAKYRLAKGEATLAVFSYPTLEMARQQTPAYEKIPGVLVKRTGSLVALVAPANPSQPPDPAEAQKLLSEVNYQASVSWNEPLPLVVKPETAAQMILGIITLAGIVLGFCLVSGLTFGAIRIVARKFGYSGADGSMTTLHLSGK
ncbi:MAG TPA: hypothetical protein VKX49_30545 [Bryobacteraceae bacterium]|nr:hypothetical protein [Bryobacteraceae bacterium]